MKNKKLYRDPNNGKLGGICAGIAEYFDTEVWLIRLLVVSAFLFSAGLFVVLAYVVTYFILDEMPEQRKWQQSSYKKHHIKQKSWQAGDSADKVLENVSAEIDKMEKDVEHLESYVTSFSYKMDQEFTNHK
ncbi:MAG: envelope stress response membrane protein PspC [Psychromonas sp.]